MNTQEPDATFETKSGHEARVGKLSHDHENEAQLCIWSQARQEKDEAILAKKRERFESDLADLHNGLSKPRCTRKQASLHQEIRQGSRTAWTVAGTVRHGQPPL